MIRWSAAAFLALSCMPMAAEAAPAYACNGAALAGGAQLLCSHVDPKAPAQNCNFSWALRGSDDSTSVVQGTFLLAPGSSNVVVYQGFGYDSALSGPVVVCEGTPG